MRSPAACNIDCNGDFPGAIAVLLEYAILMKDGSMISFDNLSLEVDNQPKNTNCFSMKKYL